MTEQANKQEIKQEIKQELMEDVIFVATHDQVRQMVARLLVLAGHETEEPKLYEISDPAYIAMWNNKPFNWYCSYRGRNAWSLSHGPHYWWHERKWRSLFRCAKDLIKQLCPEAVILRELSYEDAHKLELVYATTDLIAKHIAQKDSRGLEGGDGVPPTVAE